MDNEKEPTDIRDFLPPEANVLGVDEPNQVDLATLLQIIGEKEVQLLMLRRQVNSLTAAVERLAKRPRKGQFGTQPHPAPPEPTPESS